MRNSTGSSTPTRCTLMVTGTPLGPRSALTAWSSDHPSALWPSISRKRSPTRTPARSAGVPGSTPTAVIHPSRGAIWIPTPAYSPEVCRCSCAYSSAVMKTVCGSPSSFSIPSSAFWYRSLTECSST
jgi:hypothetical protein